MVQFLKKYQKVQWMIFIVALFIYANTIPNKWAFDDSLIIQHNNFVKRGASGIADIMSNDAFAGYYGKDINMVAGGRYRPLSIALFAIQAEIFATAKKDINQKIEKDKEGYKIKDLSEKTLFPNILHFFNALWYALLCMILYKTLLLLFLSKVQANSTKANFLAFATTLIYTVHPLHTEAVANVKGLDEILVMLCSIGTLYFVLKQFSLQQTKANVKNKKYLLLAMVSYTLALFAKESSITFIPVIPLALWVFTNASIKNIFKLIVPLLLPIILFFAVRAAVLYQPDKAEITKELLNDPFLVLDSAAQYAPLVQGSATKVLVNPNENTFAKMPYSNQLATNFYTWGKYLQLLIVPNPLTVDYYPRHIEIKSFKDLGVIFSVIFHLFLLAWALFNIRKKKIIAFGILYYFITFSIVSNLLFPIGTNMAERFMFMPSLGFCLIMASLLYQLAKKWSGANEEEGLKKTYLILGALALVFSWISFQRNFDWKDNFTLFTKDIKVSKNSAKIHIDLAGELIKKANPIQLKSKSSKKDLTVNQKQVILKETEAERVELLNNAITLLNKSLEIHPQSNQAWLLLGNANLFLGQMEGNTPNVNLTKLNIALAAFEQADKYKSSTMDSIIIKFKSLCNMGIGKIMGEQFGDISTSISFLEKASTQDPKNAEILLLLGTAYSIKQDFEKSISYTQKSLLLQPNNWDTKKNLATAYQQYAFANASKKSFLVTAEKLLLEVLSKEEKLPDNDDFKNEGILRTLNLLVRNYTIQGKVIEQKKYNDLLLQLKTKEVN